MKLRVALAVMSALASAAAIADPVYITPGSNLVYGNSSNNQSIMSSVSNPAAPAAQMTQEESQYRFGILSSIGGGFELGNVGDLYNTIDNSKNTINNPIDINSMINLYATDCGATTTCNNPGQFAADIATTINNSQAVQDLNNTILPALQRDGNATVFFGGHLPLTPFVITKKNWGGSFVLDLNGSAIANMTFIEDPFSINPTTASNIATNYQAAVNACNCPNPTSFTMPNIPNDSTLVVKAAAVGELGLGYSRPVLNKESGDLTAGVRLKYYQVKLARDAQPLNTSNGAQNTFKSTLTYTSSTGMGVDLGTLWTAKRYRLGAWVNNLNGPSFKYNAIDTTALGYTNTNIINILNADVTYKMKPQIQTEAAFFSESQNWVLNATLDANAVPDPVGREFQWATVSAAYATNSWWIPGARLGYRTNLAGSKLSYATAGLTLFKALSLDVAYGLDSISYNGKSYPRSAMFNLGLQMTF